MIEHLRITIVVDNLVRRSDLIGEHGLAFWIEADEQRILFDTGQGRALASNLDALGIDLGTATALVLSHGHYDHSGGLAIALARAPQARLHLHPATLTPKYARDGQPPHRFIGMPERIAESLRFDPARLVLTRQPTPIGLGVWVTGEIPRRSAGEDVGGPFYLDAACTDPDRLVDDQALYLQTVAGWVVVLGCAHAGVVNTLDYIATLADTDRILAVLGGLHLERASPERLEATTAAFARYQVRQLVPAHCTGGGAAARLWAAFPDRWAEAGAGRRFEYGAPAARPGR